MRSCQQHKMEELNKNAHTSCPRALVSPRSSIALSGPFCAQKPKLRIFQGGEKEGGKERRGRRKEEGPELGGAGRQEEGKKKKQVETSMDSKGVSD